MLYRFIRFHFFIFLFFITFLPGRLLSQASSLFDRDEVLSITLSGNLMELLKDRTGEPQYFPITLSYQDVGSKVTSIPIKAKTRGNFRRDKANCYYPPLLLNFSKESEKTIFSEQDKVKLVMPCQGDQYVVREYLVYKLYNLVSPKSFRARLVKITLDDPNLKEKDKEPLYGILLEEEEQMAKRNGMVLVERQLVRPEQTVPGDFLNMAVFEYLIGNTDWSVQYRQNVKLIASDTTTMPFTVPYDFDHSGIVDAPYARPAAALAMSSVRQRRYRGFCISDMVHYEKVIAHYNQLKESIYSVYTSTDLLDEKEKKSIVKYLDEFFETINNPKKIKEEFQYPCRKDGTGNVVIKGLNKN